MNIRLFLFLVLICNAPLYAQIQEISKEETEAVNGFIIYGNAVIQWISDINEEFTVLNKDFINYVENRKSFQYQPKGNKENTDFEGLYNKALAQSNRLNSDKTKEKALDLLRKTRSVKLKIESLRKSLDSYVNSKSYKNDSILINGFEMLQKIEVAYFDIYALQEKLYWSAQTIYNNYPKQTENYIILLDKTIQASKRVMRALRADDRGPIIKDDLKNLNAAVSELKKYKTEVLKGSNDFTSLCYDQILKKSESIKRAASDFVANNTRHEGKEHKSSFYYFNEELLPAFNETQEGTVYYFHRIIEKNRLKVLLSDEMPPIFEVLFPKHPYYDSLKADFIPDVDAFMANLEKKRDSLKNVSTEKPKEFDKNMDVREIKTGQSFRIENLYFKADSVNFTSGSVNVLNQLAEFLIKNPSIKVEIGGHTNGLPPHSYCDRLSSERAESVRNYLISKGVSSVQISSKGYGKRQPLADNNTEEGRKLNQRVEVKVLEK